MFAGAVKPRAVSLYRLVCVEVLSNINVVKKGRRRKKERRRERVLAALPSPPIW